MLESQVPSHVILCPSDKPVRSLCCEQRRAQRGDVWEQAQIWKPENLVGYSIPTIPETRESLLALRHRAARALLLVVSTGPNLKFNWQKGQGTWPEEMPFSSQVLSDGRNCFYLQVLSHFHTLTTLFKSCPHHNITPTTSIFNVGTKKETHSHLALDECCKQNVGFAPTFHTFYLFLRSWVVRTSYKADAKKRLHS